MNKCHNSGAWQTRAERKARGNGKVFSLRAEGKSSVQLYIGCRVEPRFVTAPTTALSTLDGMLSSGKDFADDRREGKWKHLNKRPQYVHLHVPDCNSFVLFIFHPPSTLPTSLAANESYLFLHNLLVAAFHRLLSTFFILLCFSFVCFSSLLIIELNQANVLK